MSRRLSLVCLSVVADFEVRRRRMLESSTRRCRRAVFTSLHTNLKFFS